MHDLKRVWGRVGVQISQSRGWGDYVYPCRGRRLCAPIEDRRWALMFNDGSVGECCCHRAQLILIYKQGRQEGSKYE